MAFTSLHAENLTHSSSAEVDWRSGVSLVMGSWCTVLAAGALAPVLPQIGAAFPHSSGIDFKVGLLATAPSLAVALSAIPLGRLADRIGLTVVLLFGLLLYGVCGVLPFFALQSIEAIIATRFAVGIGEAAVMLTSTALIGVLYSGAARARWVAAQVVSANVLGVLILLGGGVLGLFGWRMPFLVYAFALLLFIPCALFLPREKTNHQREGLHSAVQWPPGLIALLAESCTLIAWSTISLFVIFLELPFVLTERGATNSATIGVCLAVGGCGVASGAAISGALTRIAAPLRLVAAFAFSGAGLLGMATASNLTTTSASAAITGLGSGLVIPTLLARLLGATPAGAVGSVTGWWIAATFAAQFANAPLFMLLRTWTGTHSASIATFGIATCCLAMALALRARPNQTNET